MTAEKAPTPEASAATPYAGLTPDRILDALQSIGLFGDGRLLALNSFENRVYQVGVDAAAPVVVKFYRPGRWSDAQIDEEHAFAAELAEREIPVVAPLTVHGRTLHRFAGFRFAVFPRQGGRTPELEDPATLQWIGRFVGRMHAVGAARSYAHRPSLDIDSFGREPRDWLLAHALIPAELLAPWRSIVELALAAVEQAYERAAAGGGMPAPIRLHGDFHAGNLLWTDAGPHFVDLDDSRMGPAIQDLWMLLSGERDGMQSQLDDLLTGYHQFMDFDPRQLALIEPLRTLRLLHYSAWLARRWADPAFPAAFPWFGTQRYWQDRILELREQVALMQEPPLSPPAA
ncbi:MAG: serine/threonine protein kinase [Burkholderiales bacterium]|nr:MAG: serine/threonine protein kinase [Burkholderiales bacterium]